jgi:hypothetical protein
MGTQYYPFSTTAGPETGPEEPAAVEIISSSLAAPLRAMYEPFEKQPIPDEHVALLLALRWKEREQRRGASAD